MSCKWGGEKITLWRQKYSYQSIFEILELKPKLDYDDLFDCHYCEEKFEFDIGLKGHNDRKQREYTPPISKRTALDRTKQS